MSNKNNETPKTTVIAPKIPNDVANLFSGGGAVGSSKYGHRSTSMAGIIDNRMLQNGGIAAEALVTELMASCKRTRVAALAKIASHGTYLVRKFGVKYSTLPNGNGVIVPIDGE